MTAIVRIKRRRDEDPKDSILLSCKKLKASDGATCEDSKSTIFRFAGTVFSKEEAISITLKEAIRKEKLEREFKQHQINAYGEIREHKRNEQRQSSKKSRYKVVSNHRLLNLDSLEDLDIVVRDNSNNTKREYDIKERENDVTNDCDDKINTSNTSKSNSETCDKSEKGDPDKDKGAINIDIDTEVKNSSKSVGAESSETWTGSEKDKKLFCLLDVEPEMPTYQSVLKESSSNQITCNSQPMEREVISERRSDDDFVYDLYYVNNRDFDFGLLQNRNVTFESPSGNWLYNGPASDEEFVYDDEDDSNDENNWRNDYPDEYDPFFHEDEDDGDHFFHRGPYELPNIDGGQDTDLADWMSRRCNIEDENELSSDDDVERYESGPGYSSGYYRYIKELNKQDSDDERDFLDT